MLAAIPIAAAFGMLTMPVLLAVATLAALLTVFFDVAYQSYFPSLVESTQIVEGNSRLAMSASTAEVIGPGLTGFLVGWLTAPRAIALDAFSFLISAGAVLSIRRPEPPPHGHAAEWTWRDAFAGFGIVWRHEILRPLALRAATISFFFGFFFTLYIYYAVEELRIKPALLGILVTLGGIGAFGGAWLAGRVVPRFKLGHVLIAATFAQGLLMLFIPLAHGPLWFAAGCLGISQLFGDVCFPVYGIHETSLRQKIAPPEHLGRVNACMQLLFKGLMPLGSLASGYLATQVGSRPTMVISAVGVLSSGLWLLFSPVRNLAAHPE